MLLSTFQFLHHYLEILINGHWLLFYVDSLDLLTGGLFYELQVGIKILPLGIPTAFS